MNIKRKNLLKKKFYFQILKIRKVEEKLAEIYRYEKIRCPMHLSIGQEAIAVAVSNNLKKNDQIVSNHRNHAHYLARGCSLKKMFAEMYGKKSGSNGGRGGSMNLFSREKNFMISSPIVGNSIPVGVGLALEKKINKKKDIVCIYLGDAATEEGVFYESLNFAKLHSLKCLFIIENNFYSVYTSIKKRRKNGLDEIYNLLNIKSYILDATNIIKCNKKIEEAINYIKKKSKPAMIFVKTYRFLEHCGPNNDDLLNYRSLYEINKWKKKCTLTILERDLFKSKNINYTTKKNYLAKINHEIKEALKFAENSSFPNYKTAKEKVYSS